MNNFEYIRYEPTPQEKHWGIATIKAYGKIVLKFKIVPTKDGLSFFPAPASYKMDQGKYVPAFYLDSNCEKEELESLIRQGTKHYIDQISLQSQKCPPNLNANHIENPYHIPIGESNEGVGW